MGNHEAAESSETTGKTGFRLSKAPITEGRAAAMPEPTLPDYEDLGSLPAEYGEPVLYLVARDPEWFFAYWELPDAEGDESLSLRVFSTENELLCEVEIGGDTREWYIPIPERAAGRCFHAEIGTRTSRGWQSRIRSNPALVPPRGLAGEAGADRFATIPFHLAFQKLLDMVRPGADGEGLGEEPLASALARLQGEGRQLAAVLGLVPDWNDEQRALLATLLGHRPEELEGRTPDEIDALLRKGLSAHLSSGAASQWPTPTWLDDALAAMAEGAASPSSEALMSWARSVASSLSGASLSSWLSSWQSAISGASSSEWLSSWPGREAETSRAYWTGHLFSWSSGAGGLGSGGLSSGDLGSSWSAQPFGAPRERDFFLHVNAEVIFYGGTHPLASVTINGEPVSLEPDGTFRHHFRFPDGAGSVPIIARSPDGVEQRGVLLRFERGTGRDGESTETPQPEELPDPLWRSRA